jgi:hypothetical protein
MILDQWDFVISIRISIAMTLIAQAHIQTCTSTNDKIESRFAQLTMWEMRAKKK